MHIRTERGLLLPVALLCLGLGFSAQAAAVKTHSVKADLHVEPTNSGLCDVQLKSDKNDQQLTLDWECRAQSMEERLKSMKIDPKDVHFRVVINGERLPEEFPWTTRSYSVPMPNAQTDFYLEVETGHPAQLIDRSAFAMRENLDSQQLKASSFSGVLKTSPLKVDLPASVRAKGYNGHLADVAFEKGYQKVTWVLRANAKASLRDLLVKRAGQLDVEIKRDSEGQPLSANIIERASKKVLLKDVSPDQFYFKLDAAFSGNSFFWDDMLVSVATVSSDPWLVRSTVEFWLDVQAANGGVIPREVRKVNLKSFFFPEVVKLGGPSRPNLTYTNPYLIDWVAEELYRYAPTAENLALLKRVAKSIDEYSDWMFRNRSVYDGKGQWIGFTTDALATGLDNSRGSRGNDFAEDAYKSAWVDVLAQQISMYKSASRWNERFAQAATEPAEKATYLAKAKELKEKAANYDALLNKNYWNEKLGFYFDLIPDGHGGLQQDTKYFSVAGFWALYSESPSPAQLKRLIETQFTADHFGGDFPIPANSRHTLIGTDPKDDGYWDMRSHWPSMASVVVEGLERLGESKLASDISVKFLKGMQDAAPETVAEFYGEWVDPNGVMHARIGQHGDHHTRLDFAGWGKVPPLYFGVRHVIGFQPQVDGTVVWKVVNDLPAGEQMGVRNVNFGGEKISVTLRHEKSGSYAIDSTAHRPLTFQVEVDGQTQTIHTPGETPAKSNAESLLRKPGAA